MQDGSSNLPASTFASVTLKHSGEPEAGLPAVLRIAMLERLRQTHIRRRRHFGDVRVQLREGVPAGVVLRPRARRVRMDRHHLRRIHDPRGIHALVQRDHELLVALHPVITIPLRVRGHCGLELGKRSGERGRAHDGARSLAAGEAGGGLRVGGQRARPQQDGER